MTQQAKNCLALFVGGNVDTIKQLLKIQKPSIVAELKEHFSTQDIDVLAIRLSHGK